MDVVKLCDFGLSKIIGTKERKKNLKSSCVGTKKYMVFIFIIFSIFGKNAYNFQQAPEMRNQQVIDGKIDSSLDVYSFGVLLAELLGYPFHKSTFDFAKFEKKRDKQAPDELVSLVFICTKPTPESRPKFRDILHGLQLLESSLSLPILTFDRLEEKSKPTNRSTLSREAIVEATRKALERPATGQTRKLKRSVSANNMNNSFSQTLV